MFKRITDIRYRAARVFKTRTDRLRGHRPVRASAGWDTRWPGTDLPWDWKSTGMPRRNS